MHRRELLLAGLSLPVALALPAGSRAATAAGEAFDAGTVPALARALAAAPYRAPSRALPDALAGLGYDRYRDYRYRPDRALWHGQGRGFEAQFFHRGYMFLDRVDMHVVEGGRSRPFPYATGLFRFEHGVPAPPAGRDIGFAGFRLHGAVHQAGTLDEIAAFLGASYFRAVARGLGYGLSARGLALGSGDPGAEEFPVFRAFWLETPAPGAAEAVVHALLDSPSVAGAFRFAITAGADTVFDVDARLYPRVELATAGIAPLTSMYEFDAHDRAGIDDPRPAVHDSDGLALWLGSGEEAWRPLRNPRHVEHSGFQDRDPHGFGLMQRKRRFEDYQDLEAGYEKRPGCRVEPLDPWGEGEVHLVEIPTANEYADNIVAFWRPRAPLAPGREHRFRYRLHWSDGQAWMPGLARVVATRSGTLDGAPGRQYLVDFVGDRLPQGDGAVRVQASANAGELRNATAYRNPATGGWRVGLELLPGDAAAVELRLWLEGDAGRLSETWLSRWTP
ncbi:glucan biosynthesis protein G [Luteimonas sp. MC1750]|uniref:glucan biosynthesis protein n=1 Tax=Luteimonas sp. MC1750 TaxID=2799326 RepID=UPI0018F0C07D|nr:glucan biosynthesis protein G [Luteimonas sp. MC1750]MBJ6985008.1 glucan biosynthesis protein G [Luteimonas sp. MC1750]QQO05676.1 glucan biosynthesis protein G [Luteimonas sp. MC1750]